MNRGHIPGFYYDEARQKYFRIQPDHQAPAGAKHARGNVKREKRRVKARKDEQLRQRSRDQSKVGRSKVLSNSPLHGVSLEREMGLSRISELLCERDKTFVSGLDHEPERIKFSDVAGYDPIGAKATPPDDCCMIDAHYMSQRQELAIISRIHGVWAPEIDIRTFDCYGQFPPVPGQRDPLTRTCIPAPDDNGRQTSVIVCGSDRETIVLANNHFPSMGAYLRRERSEDYQPSPVIQVITPTDLYGAALRDGSKHIAMREISCVSVFDCEVEDVLQIVELADTTNWGEQEMDRNYCPSIDWLSPNIVFFGDNRGQEHSRVMLYDLRSGGTSGRFHVKSRITGMATADNSESRILVSTNQDIHLFDTRMGQAPLLSIAHEHHGAESRMATNKLGLVAAVDSENVVQVYSIRTGTRLGSLSSPATKTWHRPVISRLKWFSDDRNGPGFTACLDNSFILWRWDGRPED